MNNPPYITLPYLSLAWICLYLVEELGKRAYRGKQGGKFGQKHSCIACRTDYLSIPLPHLSSFLPNYTKLAIVSVALPT